MQISKALVPYSVLLPVRQVHTGDVLVSDCFGRNGQKVARTGDKITGSLLKKLNNMGVRKAWIQRTVPEWMSPAEARINGFEIVETRNTTPLHHQILSNFQGTFSTHGSQQLFSLIKKTDSLPPQDKVSLNSIKDDFEELQVKEENLREKISELDDRDLRENYLRLLSLTRPQNVDPSNIDGGEAALGRKIQQFLEDLKQVNNELSDLILEMDEDELQSLVSAESLEDYESSSNFMDSFVLFDRLFSIPEHESLPVVNDVFDTSHEILHELFYNRSLDREKLERVDQLLWEEFDPDVPHWILTLGQPGEPDGYLFSHAVNTAILVSQLYRLSDREPVHRTIDLTLSCLSMDIGMILIPQSFHLHQDELTSEQFETMKIHPTISYEFLESVIPEFETARDIVEQHHERLDGSGYPKGVVDLDQDLALLTLCDMFDAMTSPRMWRSSIPPQKTLQTLRNQAGESISNYWINQLISEIGIYPVGSVVRLTNEQPSIVVDHDIQTPQQPKVIPIDQLMNNPGSEDVINLTDSDLSIQTGGTSLRAPAGLRNSLIEEF
ncbi:MAG: HD-GYP domain-containing protein [bacterium]